MELKRQRQSGLSLLEVLITLTIFSIGLLGLAKLQTELLSTLNLTMQRSQALDLAESKLAELRSYHVIKSTTGLVSYTDIASGTERDATNTYQCTWTVTIFTNPDYKKVKVVVQWTSSQNTVEQVELNTIIASLDPLAEGVIMN